MWDEEENGDYTPRTPEAPKVPVRANSPVKDLQIIHPTSRVTLINYQTHASQPKWRFRARFRKVHTHTKFRNLQTRLLSQCIAHPWCRMPLVAAATRWPVRTVPVLLRMGNRIFLATCNIACCCDRVSIVFFRSFTLSLSCYSPLTAGAKLCPSCS